MGVRHGIKVEAFPGDSYVADLKAAAKTDKPWVKFLTPAVVVAALADFFFMQQALGLVMEWDFIGGRANPHGVNYLSYAPAVVCGIAIIIIYLAVGLVAGKSLKQFHYGRKRGSLVAFIICMIVEIAAIVGFTYLRYQGESANKSISSPMDATVMMALFMVLAAFMMIYRSFIAGDSEAIEIAIDAQVHAPDDRALYDRVFTSYAVDSSKERDYERREREIDRRAIDSAFRLGAIASRLNGVLDPADAYEFQHARQMAIGSYYAGEPGERGENEES